VVEFLDARRRPVKEKERKPGPFPYYGANGQQGTIDGYLFDEPLVLLAEDGGFFDQPQRGVAYRISGKSWVNNHAHVLRPKPSMDVGFLCRVLENYHLAPFITGTTRGKLTKASAEEVLVPVPPLDEQRRIATILDQTDDLRRKRWEALNLIELLPSHMFEETFSSANSTTELGAVTTQIYRYPTYYNIEYVPNGVPEIRGEMILAGGHVSDDKRAIRFISEGTSCRFPKTVVEAGDLVMSVRGTVGKLGLVPSSLAGANITANLIRIAPDRTMIDPIFLWHAMQARGVQDALAKASSTTTIATIKAPDLKALKIVRPPLDEQRAFAASVAEIDKLKAQHRAHLAKLDALFASLQHRAFRGAL
jgi:type I restriction enzyme S subunit